MNVCRRTYIAAGVLPGSRRRLAAAALVVGALTVSATPAQAAPAVECGTTLTISTTLTSDLTCESGLTLAEGVSLDLGGHTLTGPGADSWASGIVMQGGTATTVSNGTVTGWGFGIVTSQDGSGFDATRLVTAVTLAGNGTGVGDSDSVENTRWGVTGSTFVDNISGISAYGGGSVTVTGSTFTDNVLYGIDSSYSSVRLVGGTISGSRQGLFAWGGGVMAIDGTVFAKNDVGVRCSERIPSTTGATFWDNTSYGFDGFDCAGPVTDSSFTGSKVGWHNRASVEVEATTAGGMRISDSRFTANGTGVLAEDAVTVTTSRFTWNGTGLTASSLQKPLVHQSRFRMNGTGIYLTNGGSIGGVRATYNRGHGIYAPGAVDLGGNVAFGNGSRPQCVGVVCARR